MALAAPQFAASGEGDIERGQQQQRHVQQQEVPHESSDEFRMYWFKVKRCGKTQSHDWTECPYAHRGEKARRRDPRKFPYHAVACPEFRRSSAGECSSGQLCRFAHGVFEFWLHPSRYRTRPCHAGHLCRRKVCFFAHTPQQLRLQGGCHHLCPAPLEMVGGGGGDASDGDAPRNGSGETSELPDIDWIYELVK